MKQEHPRPSAAIRGQFLPLFATSLALLLAACTPATPTPAADLPPAVVRAAGAASVDPGNYCVACHTAGDDRLAHALDWAGGIEREAITPCPAVVQARQEVYYTERLLLAIDRGRASVPASATRDRAEAQVAAARQTYSRLLDTPLTSLDAFSAEALALRYRLGKVYASLNQLDAAVKRDRILLVAGLVTLALLISLAWGWRNTLRFGRTAADHRPPATDSRPSSSVVRRPSFVLGLPWRPLVLAGLTLLFFSLPLFRVPAAVVATPTAEEQARQTALDAAARKADVADRALGRAWMLARVGAEMGTGDKGLGDEALTTALAAADAVRTDAAALWGEGQTVQEAAVGSLASQEKALLIADRLGAAQNRAWALRLIAEEWIAVDPKQAEAILQQALATATNTRYTNTYSDLDLRALAVTWAGLNKARGLEVAGQVADPALRAWAYREIAVVTEDPALFKQAAEAALAVPDPIRRSQALREIALRWGDQAPAAEALAALAKAAGAQKAYAVSDLAVVLSDARLIEQIGAASPAARARTLFALGKPAEALTAAGAIADPFERARAQAAVAAWSLNADAARQVSDPTLRDRALRDIAIAKKDVALAQSIASAYERIQALTALAPEKVTADDIAALKDTYPLRGLAVALAQSDPNAALALVEKMEREADKAEPLRAVAAATGDAAFFDRALSMALAARVRGDALAPAEASLALARQAKVKAEIERALTQALDAAQKITVKYK
ncbi:MAG: hypothetical protein NT169_16695 [Chloroflexi bacterium]|nr:hypothetical protein [Chloroflexota bacterium]